MLPLVCSRWRRLADSPQLVRSFSLFRPGLASLPCLAAFRGWLERSAAAAAVRSLELSASAFAGGRYDNFSAADKAQLRSELLRISAACGGLQQLTLEATFLDLPGFDVSSLLAGLPSLQLLHLSLPNTVLELQAPLDCLPQLRDLRLQGEPVRLGPAAALPPALTRLSLGGFADEHAHLDFPAQASVPLRASWLGCMDWLHARPCHEAREITVGSPLQGIPLPAMLRGTHASFALLIPQFDPKGWLGVMVFFNQLPLLCAAAADYTAASAEAPAREAKLCARWPGRTEPPG